MADSAALSSFEFELSVYPAYYTVEANSLKAVIPRFPLKICLAFT